MGTYPSKDIVAAAEAATSMQGGGRPASGAAGSDPRGALIAHVEPMSPAADAGFEADAQLFVVVETVDHLDKRTEFARRLLHLDHLGVLQNVPPLPVSMVGSYEMLEYRLVVMNQTANGHRRPFEHYRIPEVIVEH